MWGCCLVAVLQVAAIDFFAESPFPSGFDVISMSMILHDYGPRKKLLLIQKVCKACAVCHAVRCYA